jgi:hypothetical protein
MARVNSPPKVAQTLMRHSMITLTTDRHSHFGVYDDTAGALGRVSTLFGRTTPPESHAMMATRTDGKRISAVFATHLPLRGDGLGRIGTGGGGNGPPSQVEGTPLNSLIGEGIDGSRRDLMERGAGRIRTADGGFADLCLATWLRRRLGEDYFIGARHGLQGQLSWYHEAARSL